MALARIDVPSVLLYGGSILPGHFRGHDVTIQTYGFTTGGDPRVDANVEPIELTATEYDLLEMLMRAAGRVVSRDEITAAHHARAPRESAKKTARK